MVDIEKDQRLRLLRQYWDKEADSFDKEPDHGLADPVVLEAWTTLLDAWLPHPQAKILDIGCGTGSLTVVLAGLGHLVTGIDLSPVMISYAERKAARAGLPLSFHVMEASFPRFSSQQFDGIICRHLLWSLPNIADVLRHWVTLLKPGGRLLLIEGYWHTGGGLHCEELVAALPPSLTDISIKNLSSQSGYWGKEVNDERYAIMADNPGG